MPGEFDLRVEEPSDDRWVVAVGGELDLATTPELRAALKRILESGAKSVVVDLSECSFIDSSGLAALLALRGSEDGHGTIELALVGAHEQVERTLAISGTDKLVPVFGTLDEAREAISAG